MRSLVLAGCVGLMLCVQAASGTAQEGPGGLINPQKDCHTITTCNFARGGRYRGCVSSYSCRTCRFVTASCRIAGKSGTCRRLRCGWGG